MREARKTHGCLSCWSVLSLGKIDSLRPCFHDAYHIWPIGYKVSWSEAAGASIIFEILDSNYLKVPLTPVTHQFPKDAPVFKVEYILNTKFGAKSEEFYSISVSNVWEQLSSRAGDLLSGVDDSFGLESLQIQLSIENLDGASECEDYEFLARRSNLNRVNENRRRGRGPQASLKPADAQRKCHAKKNRDNQSSDICPSNSPFSDVSRGTHFSAEGGPAANDRDNQSLDICPSNSPFSDVSRGTHFSAEGGPATNDRDNQSLDICPSITPLSNVSRGTPLCAVGGPAEVQIRFFLELATGNTAQGYCNEEQDQLATSQSQRADRIEENLDLWIPATARKVVKSGRVRASVSLCDGTTFKMRLGDARLRWNPDDLACASQHLSGLSAATLEEAERVPEIAVELIELVAMLHAFRSAT
jgi:hypothetical protein